MSPVGLRARPATGLIDTLIACLRRRYWDYFLAALIPALPFLVIAVFVSARTLRYVQWAEILTSGIGVGISACLVSQEYTGQAIALGEAVHRSLRRAAGLIGVSLLTLLAVLAGFAIVIVGSFLCVGWLYAAVPAYALEPVTVFDALGRSAALSRGLLLHVLGVAIPAALGAGFTYYGAEVAIHAAWLALPNHAYVPVRVATLLMMLVFIATRPVLYVAHAVVYFDLRIRRDGFDIEAMAAALDDAAPVVPAAHPPNAPAADPA